MQIAPPTTTSRSAPGNAPLVPAGQLLPFALITLLFFIWGMSNNLTDILVQQFRKSFELSWVQAQLVQTAVFFGYFCVALPAAFIMRRFGYKAGIIGGLVLFAIGTLAFWPAAIIGHYAPFLIALFIVGIGSATLETAANPFIAQFGSPATSERRLNLSQSLNPPGAITGVLLGTNFIFSGIELPLAQVELMKHAGTYAAYLHTEIMRVVPVYVGLSVVLLVLAAIIGVIRFPPTHEEQDALDTTSRFSDIFRTRTLMLAVVAQFFYVGAQVATWSNFIPYIKQYTADTERTAGYFLTGTLVAFALGRFFSTALMRYIAPRTIMGIFACINIGLVSIAIFAPGRTGVWAILATSFFMSLMYPTIFALGIRGLGANTKVGGSLMVMSIIAGAIFPPVMGLMAGYFHSLAIAYQLPLYAYIVVALFSLFGTRGSGRLDTMANV